MSQDRNALGLPWDILLRIPGIAPGAIKRNVLVVLLYLVMFGVLFSLYFILGEMWHIALWCLVCVDKEVNSYGVDDVEDLLVVIPTSGVVRD